MDNYELTKKRALRILGKRNFSERGMLDRLLSKGESRENAEETVRWLVELGYINDSDYATLIVNHYSANGYGEMRIKDELFKRGIAREMWEEKLAAVQHSEQLNSAVEFLKKKLRNSEPQDGDMSRGYDKDELRRAVNALVRRGFSYDDANSAVNRYLEELRDESLDL